MGSVETCPIATLAGRRKRYSFNRLRHLNMPRQQNIFGDEFDDEPDDSDIEDLDPEAQKQKMREWFFDHYTNPLDNTPYESAEGGYIYIWGGPYDAREELNEEFSGEVPDDIIEELADELNEITIEWTGNPDKQASMNMNLMRPI